MSIDEAICIVAVCYGAVCVASGILIGWVMWGRRAWLDE